MTQRRPGIRKHEIFLLAVLLLLRAGLSIAYSLATPLGEAPDEADHYAYAAYIVQEGRLPAGPEMTQGKHPPLYYLAAALAGKIAGGTADRNFLRANPDMAFGPDSPALNFFVHTALEDPSWQGGVLTMRAGRFVSILAGLVLVLATYLLGRALWPRQLGLALGGAAFAAFLPESLFVGSVMSNDMFAAMWSALALLFTAKLLRTQEASVPESSDFAVFKRFPPTLTALLAGLCLGFAFVSKASTGSLAVVLVAALLLDALGQASWRWPGWRRLSPVLLLIAVIGVAAFLVAAPWLWRNWRLYRDPFGWSLVLATIDRRAGPLTVPDVVQLLRGWWLSFWGKFGGAGHIPLPTAFYVLWAALGLASAGGWVAAIVRREGKERLHEPRVGGWTLLVGAPLVTAAGIYSYSQTALGTDQGRLLFPALAPLALLIYSGISAWIPAPAQRRASVAFAAGMVLVAVAALVWGLVPPFEPPSPPPVAQVAASTPVGTRIGPLELAGASWDTPSPGQLTLYWTAAETTPEDLRTDLRVLDANGALLWDWKRSPGAGRFSTDRWPAGRVVADTYRIPPDALARAATAQVGLRPFPEGPWLPIDGQAGGQFLTLPR